MALPALWFRLVLLTVVTQGLKVRPGGAEIAVALGVGAAYLLIRSEGGGIQRSGK